MSPRFLLFVSHVNQRIKGEEFNKFDMLKLRINEIKQLFKT